MSSDLVHLFHGVGEKWLQLKSNQPAAIPRPEKPYSPHTFRKFGEEDEIYYHTTLIVVVPQLFKHFRPLLSISTALTYSEENEKGNS
jgi:hypothetical protein